MSWRPASQFLTEDQVTEVRIVRSTRGQQDLVAKASSKFRSAAIPANRAEYRHAPLIDDD
jgi:hypothetical protein